MEGTTLTERVLAAHHLGAVNEHAMYPALVEALNSRLPPGFDAVSHGVTVGDLHPDVAITRRSGAAVLIIEVKRPGRVGDALTPPKPGEPHQIESYRAAGLPVWLTDGATWHDVTVTDALDRPIASFDADSPDGATEQRLTDALTVACGIRPRHTADSAVLSMAGVVAHIDSADSGLLDEGWSVVREGLGLDLTDDGLDASGVGEIVAFSLLAIATRLPDLPASTFVRDATAEWIEDSDRWDPAELPSMMSATLVAFRDQDRHSPILGEVGWVRLRAIAAWITGSGGDRRWDRLSQLWDDYLHHVGRRRTLGSWQTERAVAEFQARQVHEALQSLDYRGGLGDPNVTIIDPCVGTGIYLDAVVRVAEAEGSPPQSFNATPDGHPRLLGVDISSTAVAASHIRISETGALPTLYMTDTLATGGAGAVPDLFRRRRGASYNPVVGAARYDREELQRWASRSDDRDPVLAIIGNPPYRRGGLDRERYADMAWMTSGIDEWRKGSGGRGGLADLFIAFWAWSITLCRQPHPDISAHEEERPLQGDPGTGQLFDIGERQAMHGVVSFITNRSWLDGATFGPMRKWVLGRASHVAVSDFGPGARGGGAGSWSQQPFEIETGTAIVTITFDPKANDATVTYQRAVWTGEGVTTGETTAIARDAPSWTPSLRSRHLAEKPVQTFSGINTGDDARWIRVEGNREFSARHAFRPLDNRWGPTVPPERAPRSRDPYPHEASRSAFWREKAIFNPHRDFVREGGWYAILPASRVHPGPGVHATRHVPDRHLYKRSEGAKIVRVQEGVQVPSGYDEWAREHGVSGTDFWRVALAASHHLDFWIPGTPQAAALREKVVDPPLPENDRHIQYLANKGTELITLWTVDEVDPVDFAGEPGEWRFDRHSEVEDIKINNYPVLPLWREARPGKWTAAVAEGYARVVAALVGIIEVSQDVTRSFGDDPSVPLPT